jgi:RimJ/RimL family protein N-acetyltransferase
MTGPKVTLAAKRRSDAPRDYRWQTDAELMALSGNQLLTIPYTEYLTRYDAGEQKPETLFLSILTVSDGRHIGNCAVYDADRTKGEASIGITIGEREYWGQGYGTEAVKALLDYVFANMGLVSVKLKTLAENRRARHCFEKCGFQSCGSLREEGRDYLLMCLSYEDYAIHQYSTEYGES